MHRWSAWAWSWRARRRRPASSWLSSSRQPAQAARLEWQLASLAIRFGEDRILRATGGDPEALLAERRFRWRAAGEP